MKVLAIGDVVGSIGCNFLREQLAGLRKAHGIDLVIANGENSADGNGITPFSADYLFKSGVDVITAGNHSFRRREIFKTFGSEPHLIRPANYPSRSTPGSGVCTLDVNKNKVVVINLMGTIFMENLDCPFKTADRILANAGSDAIVIVDFHAEATSEKRALGFYLDGRISALFGTHTHVPTADECILPRGTGYITDVGMAGVIDSALGVRVDLVIRKIKTKMPVRFENATGKCKVDCIIFDIDESTKKTQSVNRLTITG